MGILTDLLPVEQVRLLLAVSAPGSERTGQPQKY